VKRIISLVLMLVLVLAFIGCGSKVPSANKAKSETASAKSNKNQTDGDHNQRPSNKTASKTLPANYPKEILPLAADAKILDVKENLANKVMEVSYVSDNEIDTLCDYYEGALKDAENLNTAKTSDGYMISARLGGTEYSIMLSKDAMKANPQYSGKISVYIILSGLEGDSARAAWVPEGKGKAWPSEDLPGVPQLEGHISQILREDGIIRIEIIVKSVDRVKSYIGELSAADFSFDTEPDVDSDHMEFLAFKDSSMISFAYKGAENIVSIEYQK